MNKILLLGVIVGAGVGLVKFLKKKSVDSNTQTATQEEQPTAA